jgi:hypothetical protein
MTTGAEKLALRFTHRVDDLSAAIRSGLRANADRRLNANGLAAIYEAAFLSAAKGFEAFLDDLFFLVMTDPAGSQSGLQDCRPRLAFTSREEAESFVLDGRDYLDWMPWAKNTVRLSSRYLVEGAPFCRLSRAPQEKDLLRVHHILRNSVAHDSGTARLAFGKLPELDSLPRNRRTPAGLLASVDATRGETYWQRHARGMSAIANALTAPTDADARTFLGSEDPYRPGEKPGDRGPFRCRRCGQSLTLRGAGHILPDCGTCKKTSQASTKWDRG